MPSSRELCVVDQVCWKLIPTRLLTYAQGSTSKPTVYEKVSIFNAGVRKGLWCVEMGRVKTSIGSVQNQLGNHRKARQCHRHHGAPVQ
jgi:hypothetical protein